MAQAEAHDAFTQEVYRLRAIYQKQRDTTKLVPPAGRIAFDIAVDVIDGITYHTYWYEIEDDSQNIEERYHVFRLADIPGTLSGDILRLKRNLPVLDTGHAYDIVGDEVRQLQTAPPLPDERDDAEDTSEMLAALPVVEVDPTIHFAKKGKYASEIRNLLACQGGCCPGVPKSGHVIQLLGKSRAAELVSNKFTPRYVFGQVYPLATYKTWILQVIDGLRCLHSVEIVHRDLRIDNLVVAESSRLVIIDLESRWGNRLAPEVSRRPILDAGWTEKSDIYDLGYLVKEMIYGNVAITNLVEWPVPPPLQAIVEACTRVSPDERPTLDELAAMVNGIVENTQDP